MRLSIFLIVAACVSSASFASAAEQSPDYNRDIAPIFKVYCNGCHNPTDKEGKLSLESYADLLKGGAGGVVVVPSQTAQSRLVLLIEGREKPAMPPEGNEAPEPEEIALLKRWVELGAKGPTGQMPDPTILVTPAVKLTAPARNTISSTAVSPTMPLAAVGAYREVRLVGLEDQVPARVISGIRGPVVDVEFSRDGKLLVTAAGEPGPFGEAQLWNAADGKLVRTFTGHRDSLYAATLSPDGKTLATASYDQMIKLWDTATGKETKTLAGHNGAVYDLAFNPTGKILASCGADRTVKLWDVMSGARLDTFSQATKELYAVAFSPDGKTVVAGGADNRIRAWTISPTAKENSNPLTVTRYAHEGPVIKLVYSADGKTLVSAGEDRMVRLWDAAKIMEKQALEKQPDWVPGLALTADAMTLAVGRMDGTFAVYDMKTAKVKPPAAPELATVVPRGICSDGCVMPVFLTGKNLTGVQNILLRDAAGKTLETWPVASSESSTSKVTLRAQAGVKLSRGAYQLVAVRGAQQSNPLTFYIDDVAQAEEIEPNDFAPKTTRVFLEVGYWGVCSRPGDIDSFRFEGKKGQTIVCQLEAKTLGSMLNGFLTMLDPDGETVATNNDYDAELDPLIAYTLPTDGIYTVRVNDQQMAGTPNHYYRLSLGTFPLVTGAYPTNIPAGKVTNVELTGYNLPAAERMIPIRADKPADVAVPYNKEKLRAIKQPMVRAVVEADLAEVEPNDAAEKAQTVKVPAYVNGRIFATAAKPDSQKPGADVDCIRFEAKKGQQWIIETEAQRRGSPVDTKLEVLTADGKPVPQLLLQAVRDSYVTFRSVDSTALEARLFNWEEMELNEYLYMSGEVVKTFRKPRGPDSGFEFYGSAGKRRDYFDTSAAGHAMDEPAYIVEPHPVGTKLINNGLPVYTLYYANDDDGRRKLGSDSRLTFTAPADGAYVVRVSDVHGFGGDHFNYRLVIREPKPDFNVTLSANAPAVNAGSGTSLGVNVERIDGFEGELAIDVAGVPAGYTVSQPITIEAGHDAARIVLNAAADAKQVPAEMWAKVTMSARGAIAGKDVVKPVTAFKSVTLEPKPKIIVRLEPAELSIAPGQTVAATLKVERNGFDERIAFDVSNLPHGVIVDNIGLSGILIREKETERQIFLTCYGWVPETSRTCFAETKTARAGGGKAEFEASTPVLLHVRKPSTLAQADEAKPATAGASAPK